MKVAFICVNISSRGGMETVLSLITRQLEEEDIEAKVFLVGRASNDEWLKNVHHNKRITFIKNKYANYVKNIFFLPYDLYKFKPDIIIGVNPRAVQLGLYVRKILSLSIPVASWMHFSLPELHPLDLLKNADFHIAISREIYHQFYNLKLVEDQNVHLVYNPVRIHEETILKPENKAQFIYVGRLIYDGQKRVNDLLHSLHEVKGEWQLTVIGDGEDRIKLASLAEDLGISSKVHWLGWVQNPWEKVREASALVLTSEYEGFGMVLIEAMSYGIPCISSDCQAGSADIITSENGWLYPQGDLSKLTTLLQTVVDDPAILPDAERVKSSIQKFNVEAITEEMIFVIQCEREKYNLMKLSHISED